MELDYEYFDNTALICATNKEYSQIVRELLAHKGIDVNIKAILNFFWF